jgi:CMP-N,N'-diacetyllegionaminic acid synthase
MRVLGIIPARGGSKGIPGKNKKDLLGKPLILYTIEAGLASSLSKIVVSTDDDQIAKLSDKAGVKVIVRPQKLAKDDTPTLLVLQHVVASMNEEFDAIMTLQPTSPLRTMQNINDAIHLFEANHEADSLVSVVKVPHNFTPGSLMKKVDIWLEYFIKEDQILRRQDKPILLARNGAAIYITRTIHLKNFLLGGKILPFEMSKLQSIDIDDMEDWILAEAILSNHLIRDNLII